MAKSNHRYVYNFAQFSPTSVDLAQAQTNY